MSRTSEREPHTPQPHDAQPLDAGDWFPWRMFVEAAGAACRFSTLLLAAGGLLAAELGVAALTQVFPEPVAPLALPITPSELSLEPLALAQGADMGLRGYQLGFAQPLIQAGAASPIGGGLVLLWRLVVWSLVGTAIARMAAMRLTHHEEPSLREAVRWSLSTVAIRVGLVACLAVAFGLVCSLVSLLGKASAVPVLGSLIALLLPVVLLIAAVGAVLGLSVVIGWPLMTAAAAAERPDPFDAVSRGLAYAYQRPLRLVAYTAQAWLVGVAAGVAVQLLVRATLRVAMLWFPSVPMIDDPALGVAGFWWAEATRLPMVYYAAYYWCAATAIYLLLRRDIDEQQADEVFLEPPSDNQPPTAGLAPAGDQAPAV